MSHPYINELISLLTKDGHIAIANALRKKTTNSLSNQDKNTLIIYGNRVRYGNSIVAVNQGFAGPSPNSGSSGFLFDQREGIGE